MLSSRIIPVILIIWGALVVLRVLFGGNGGGAYGAGQLFAGLIGALMVFAGIRVLVRN